MPKIIVSYVKYVDYASTKFGRFSMYMIFIMIGTLLLGAVTRNILGIPLSWTVEMAQFTITAYYILGGPYSMQMDDHVRMDLIYGLYSDKTKAKINNFNIDETKIEQAITSKTKAIVVMHYGGVACNMLSILNIARNNKLFLFISEFFFNIFNRTHNIVKVIHIAFEICFCF